MKHSVVALSFTLFLSVLGIPFNGIAQESNDEIGNYCISEAEDGMVISAKWKYEKWFKRGKRVLCLTVENTNGKTSSANFLINFYRGGVVAETITVEDLCVKGAKTKKGRGDGLCFKSEEFSNEELMADDFHWKIEDIEVTIGAICEDG